LLVTGEVRISGKGSYITHHVWPVRNAN